MTTIQTRYQVISIPCEPNDDVDRSQLFEDRDEAVAYLDSCITTGKYQLVDLMAWPVSNKQESGEWIIYDTEDDKLVYWSNVDGWVEHPDDASGFSTEEKSFLFMPIGNNPQWERRKDE